MVSVLKKNLETTYIINYMPGQISGHTWISKAR